MRTRWLAALALLAGCGTEPGEAEAYGAWADGEPIRFQGEARLQKMPTGRIELWATAGGRPRFLGLRIVYDPARISAAGVYPVDPAPEGRIELYCLRPTETPGAIRPETVAYEVSSGTIVVDALPGVNGSAFAGSFRDVTLARMGAPILALSHGRYRAELASAP